MRLLILTVCVTILMPAAAANAQQNRRQVPDKLEGARTEIYKTVGEVKLKMFIFEPDRHKAGRGTPAVVFFFGGGWRSGSPAQFQNQCRYLASRGMVAMSAEYRVRNRHGVTAVECVHDAKSAVRWIRENTERLGVDPERLAAGGGSAGGHLAAATGTLTGFEEQGEDLAVSSRPNAMLLFNPALDLTPKGFNNEPESKAALERAARFGTDPVKLSPTFHISGETPPAIIFHGVDDPTVPFAQAEKFAEVMKEKGNRCELDAYEGEKHGFFNWGRGGNRAFISTMRNADRFLVSLGYLEGEPTIEEFVKIAAEPAHD